MQVEITIVIMGSISSIRAILVSGTPSWVLTSCQALSYLLEPQGTPLCNGTLTLFVLGHQLWGDLG